MATLPVSPTQGFKPKRTIDVSKSRVVELAAVAHGQSSHLEAWELFASRQGARYTPLLNRGLHEMLPHTMGYRLRLAALHKLTFGPLAAEAKARGNSLEMRLGVSLYDEATGCFYGNTCNSLPCIPLPLLPTPPEPVDLEIQQDVYFHTRLLDPRCLLVIEVVLVEKTEHTTVQVFTPAPVFFDRFLESAVFGMLNRWVGSGKRQHERSEATRMDSRQAGVCLAQ